MIGNARVGKIGSGILSLLLLCGSSHCAPVDQKQADEPNQKPISSAPASDASLIYLDSKDPSFAQPIANGVVAAGAKFVRVEVAAVSNPKRYALTFEVRYQPKDGAAIYLGSFSLFPADNPGTFIVATQGKVQQAGSIVLSMVVNDAVTGDPPKATIKSIALIKQ